MMQRTANENAVGLRRTCKKIFLRDSFSLSAVSLSWQRHDILDFSCCPLSRALHVALANLQKFEFEFHLRSSPSAFSGYGWPVDQLITSQLVTPRWQTRPNKVETAVQSCNSYFNLDSIMSLLRQVFYIVSALHHCFLETSMHENVESC